MKRLGVEPLYIAVEGDAFGMTPSEIAQAVVMHA